MLSASFAARGMMASSVPSAPQTMAPRLFSRAIAGGFPMPCFANAKIVVSSNAIVAKNASKNDEIGKSSRFGGISVPLRRSVRSHASSPSATESAQASAATSVGLSGEEIRSRFLKFYEERGHMRLPSSSLVPEDPTVLLTIAGMLQFKPVFLGQRQRPAARVTTTQKCVRTNDIENVGVTARHHTFFEMLGNFSFGDYFKSEAIAMAWDLSTKELSIDPNRIWVSVFQDDDEAYAIWRDKVGVPEERIKRMGKKDNFWASGPTGPCGPCSELYYDFHPERGTEGASLEDDSRFIEFYNLVFMEYNRDASGEMTPLEQKNIDTGMGLERVAQILQGVSNNYETDLLRPIMDRAAALAGTTYAEAPAKDKQALKVVADHSRAVAYLVSDGVTPSNVGRGYVVRRLIRRIVLKGRSLGMPHPFMPDLARLVVSMADGCDPEVAKNEQRIVSELQREEEAFVATLKKGERILADILDKAESGEGHVSGADAFLLYDTFGYPLECTVESAAERGIGVDEEGFHAEMERQKKQSQAAREEVDLTAGAELGAVRAETGATAFEGYEKLSLDSTTVTALLVGGVREAKAAAGASVEIVLNKTPFYAEGGGQCGDRGTLESSSGAVVRVLDVQRAAGGDLWVHKAEVVSGEVQVGDTVTAVVDGGMRARVRCNHTATHLLQSALKAVLGPETAQQGSQVTEDRLRFDFNSPKPMTSEQIAEVERLVNQWIGEAHNLVVAEMPLDEAKDKGAVAMFGERYADVVRVVDVPGVSMELCGGTHVSNTAEIRGFKVLSEAGIASGIRRIEAVTGEGMIAHLNEMDGIVRGLSSSLKVKPSEVDARVKALQSELRAAAKDAEELRSQLALAKAASLVADAQPSPSGASVLVARLDGVDSKGLQSAAVSLQQCDACTSLTATYTTATQKLGESGAVVLGSALGDDKVALVAAFGKEVVAAGPSAGKLVGGIARVCGGGGGGRPNVAQAGGKDPSKLDEALEGARAELMAALK